MNNLSSLSLLVYAEATNGLLLVTLIGTEHRTGEVRTIGYIADVCALLAKNQVNVLDISQTVLQEYFTMIMMVDVSRSELGFAELVKLLEAEGKELNLSIRAMREDIFNAMHRI